MKIVLLLSLLPVIVTSYNCPDTKCAGTGSNSALYANCNQASNSKYGCTLTNSGYPGCSTSSTTRNGIWCNTVSTTYTCGSDVTTGKARCLYDYDCFRQKCQGTGDYSSLYVDCDQSSKKYCKTSSGGYPSCSTGSGTTAGVMCDSTTSFTCGSHSTTGAAYCAYNCYDQKCQGTKSYDSTYASCNQTAKYCNPASDGEPRCDDVGTKSGVGCSTSSYTCKSDSISGKASCIDSGDNSGDNSGNKNGTNSGSIRNSVRDSVYYGGLVVVLVLQMR